MFVSKTEKKQKSQSRISSNAISYDLENLVRDQNYLSIPNNFKNKVGVAFATTEANIMMDAGLAGIYNMGNTCFLSTGKNIFKIIIFIEVIINSNIMPKCSTAANRLLFG